MPPTFSTTTITTSTVFLYKHVSKPKLQLQPIYFFMKMVDQAHLHHMQKYHKNVFITCNILKNVSLNWILSVSSESARGPYTLKRTIACSKCKILNRTHKDWCKNWKERNLRYNCGRHNTAYRNGHDLWWYSVPQRRP